MTSVPENAVVFSIADSFPSVYVKQLLSEDQISRGVTRLSREIAEQYAGCPLTVVGVLTGSLVLLADLIRKIDLPLRVGLVQTRSYRGPVTRPGPLMINADFLPEVADRDLLLVDDIFDTGRTLHAMVDQLKTLSPRSIRSAVLLRKIGRSEVDFEPEFVAFDIPDHFVVGYGLDYQDGFRHLPYLAMLEEEDLTIQP